MDAHIGKATIKCAETFATHASVNPFLTDLVKVSVLVYYTEQVEPKYRACCTSGPSTARHTGSCHPGHDNHRAMPCLAGSKTRALGWAIGHRAFWPSIHTETVYKNHESMSLTKCDLVYVSLHLQFLIVFIHIWVVILIPLAAPVPLQSYTPIHD